MAEKVKCEYCGSDMSAGAFCPNCGKQSAAPAKAEAAFVPENRRCVSCDSEIMEERVFVEISRSVYQQGNKQVTQYSLKRALSGGLCRDCFDKFIESGGGFKSTLIGNIVGIVFVCILGVLFLILAKKIGWKLFGLAPIAFGLIGGGLNIRDEKRRANRIRANPFDKNLREFYGEAVAAAFAKKNAGLIYIPIDAGTAAMAPDKLASKYSVPANMAAQLIDLAKKTVAAEKAGAPMSGSTPQNSLGNITGSMLN